MEQEAVLGDQQLVSCPLARGNPQILSPKSSKQWSQSVGGMEGKVRLTSALENPTRRPGLALLPARQQYTAPLPSISPQAVSLGGPQQQGPSPEHGSDRSG